MVISCRCRPGRTPSAVYHTACGRRVMIAVSCSFCAAEAGVCQVCEVAHSMHAVAAVCCSHTGRSLSAACQAALSSFQLQTGLPLLVTGASLPMFFEQHCKQGLNRKDMTGPRTGGLQYLAKTAAYVCWQPAGALGKTPMQKGNSHNKV